MDPLKPLEALGRHVAREQDALLERPPTTPEATAGLVWKWHARRRAARLASRASVAIAVAGLALAAALLLRAPGAPSALRFSFGETQAPGQVGALLAAESSGPLPARFSDGTRMVLGPRSRARVAALRAEGADLVIEGGKARFDVVPRPAHRWQLSAGPFTVLVTGTRFDLTWLPESDEFRLDLHQGKVAVSGCGIEQRVELHAGETIRATCRPRRYEVRPTPAGAEASWPHPDANDGPRVAEQPPRPAFAAAVSGLDAPARSPGDAPHPASSAAGRATGWEGLARSGHYADAVAAASARGFERECESANAADLKALGDAAYFSGQVPKAERAYLALRRRFPGTPPAATAAYALGRLDFDARGAHAAAARWFQTYLRESPSGSLAREALGRLMEAQHRGGVSASRESARQYLARYPEGPHAQLARRIAQSQ